MEPVLQACRLVLAGLPDSARLLVGFSGGLDSTVLLHGLVAAAGVAGRRRITALHVDHGLADESAHWAERCAAFAAELELAFVRVDVAVATGPNLEARARHARYAAFAAELGAGDVLALAQHRDDVEESLLLHLLQGRGLYGIPRERRLGAGRLVRPLIDLPRAVLLDYATTQGLGAIQDPSNLDSSLDRNFLRGSILPQLRTRFPTLGRRLERVSRQAAATAAALTETLALSRNPLPLAVLDGLSAAAASGVLRQWLVLHEAAQGVSDAALLELLGQLAAPPDRQPTLALARGELRRHRGELHLVPPPPALAPEYALEIPGTLSLPHGRLSVRAGGAGMALPEPTPPLVVTFTQRLAAGERLRSRGHRRRPRELLRAADVPPWQRELLPVLRDAHGLLAIAGVAVRDGAGSDARLRLSWEPRDVLGHVADA